jgi:hypothetical protein
MTVIPSPELKAIRAHDIQPGLASVNLGLANNRMKKVKLIGAAAQVATYLRGMEVVSYPGLEVSVGDLGIDENLLEKALQELETVDMVTVIRKSGTIVRVEERIPRLQPFYGVLGERLEQLRPGEIENMALATLDTVSLMPTPAVYLQQMMAIDSTDFSVISTIGKNAGFLDSYTSPRDSREIMYSPVYWDERPDKLFSLVEKHGAEGILARLKQLRNKQGMPVDLLSDKVLLEAVDLGCLPTPTVSSTAGEKAFAFTPIVGVHKYEKALLTKARAIIACLRYGEHFGTITRINNPRLFLQRILERGRTLRPHTEIPQQWDLARKFGIVTAGCKIRH